MKIIPPGIVIGKKPAILLVIISEKACKKFMWVGK
jgi:hypothetical protein